MREWKQLCRVGNEVEGRLLAGYLEAEGIEINMLANRFPPYPENLGMLDAIIVRVPAEDLERAQELIAKLPQAEIDDVPELAEEETAEETATENDGSGDASKSGRSDPNDA